MNKRGFLKSLLGFVAGIPISGRAAPGTAPSAQARKVLLQHSALAGFPYYGGGKVWHALRTGDELTLHREPENQHDTSAIEVMWHQHKLGYIPRKDNAALAQLMDRGERLAARIQHLQKSRDPWDRVRVEVELWV